MAKFNIAVKSIFTFLIWVVYQLMRLCLGLVIHPYRTSREIMRGRWFIPLIFLPSGLLIWVVLTGRVAAWVIDVPITIRDFLGIFYSTLIISLGMWQLLLFYLGIRFGIGLKKN